MPDRRLHRGPHPGDEDRFAAPNVPRLRAATFEMSWLLGRGYPPKGAAKLVGDRHRLDARQREAVGRASDADSVRDARAARELAPERVAGAALAIDGFNLLTTVEAALAGGVVLGCRDGCFRDVASLHGTWRRVVETDVALDRVGERLAALGVGAATWLLDRPVSNSGRLKERIAAHGRRRGWPWSAETERDVDARLGASAEVVVTADGAVLDRAERWLNLARLVVERDVPGAWILDLAEVERRGRSR